MTDRELYNFVGYLEEELSVNAMFFDFEIEEVLNILKKWESIAFGMYPKTRERIALRGETTRLGFLHEYIKEVRRTRGEQQADKHLTALLPLEFTPFGGVFVLYYISGGIYMQTEAQKKAVKKWRKKAYKFYSFNLHREKDRDLIEKIARKTEKQSVPRYIKDLIRGDTEA